MVERLKRMREPLLWTSLVLVWLGLAVGLFRLTWMIVRGKDVFAAFQTVGNSMLSLVFVGLLVLLVLAVVFVEPMTPRAPFLVRVSAWTLAIGTGLSLISSLIGLISNSHGIDLFLELVGGLVDLVIKIAMVALIFWVDRVVTKHVAAEGMPPPPPSLGEL